MINSGGRRNQPHHSRSRSHPHPITGPPLRDSRIPQNSGGLRVSHVYFLDDLAVLPAKGKPTTPAIFLSGNGPLVDVPQYELRGAGSGGRTFVQGVRDYVTTYSARAGLIPMPGNFLRVPGCQSGEVLDAGDGISLCDEAGAQPGQAEPFIGFVLELSSQSVIEVEAVGTCSPPRRA